MAPQGGINATALDLSEQRRNRKLKKEIGQNPSLPSTVFSYRSCINSLSACSGVSSVTWVSASRVRWRRLSSPLPFSQLLTVGGLVYILELVGAQNTTADIKEYVREHARECTMLIPGRKDTGEQRLRNWKLIVNSDLATDICSRTTILRNGGSGHRDRGFCGT